MKLFEIINTIDYAKYSQSIQLFKDGKLKIFRGSKSDFKSPIERTPNTRSSKNTHNYVTTLLSNLPAWKKYPKRNNCWVMTTDLQKAYRYGNIYYAFPQNGARIGVCSQNDIFTSFVYNTGIYVSEFNNELYEWENSLNNNTLFTEDSYSSICKFLRSHWKTFKLYTKRSVFPQSYKEFLSTFTPENNNFSLFTLPQWKQIDDRECWTDSTTIFVPEGQIENFINNEDQKSFDF